MLREKRNQVQQTFHFRSRARALICSRLKTTHLFCWRLMIVESLSKREREIKAEAKKGREHIEGKNNLAKPRARAGHRGTAQQKG
jgi:hypothetical protein